MVGAVVGRLPMVLCGLVICFSRLHVSLRLVGAAVRASSESTRVTSLGEAVLPRVQKLSESEEFAVLLKSCANCV